MTQFGNIVISGYLALAPMAGVTDIAFRQVCREQGAALTCTEMVSARALMYQDGKTRGLLETLPGEHPCQAQIFGSEAALMGEAAQKARGLSNCDIIDINMGCPVGKVVKSGDGCALMREPEKARDIIEAVVKYAGCPVTVKFRKGWDKGHVSAVEFGKLCQEAGASAVTVHGRTRMQMYAGLADWDIIREVKEALKIPVVANGDVWEPEDAPRILRYTGCDLAMVGRGSFGNPWIFSRGDAAVRGLPVPPPPTVRERVDTALGQFELAARHKSEKTACLEARRHFAWYLRGVPGSARFKRLISGIQTLEEAREIAGAIRRELK